MLAALDLYCGAGGASVGLMWAGFDVAGVDNRPQPNYPFHFHLKDVLACSPEWMAQFDLIWASPPCQAFAYPSKRWINSGGMTKETVNLIPATRALLKASGRPYIIENVQGAPLIDPVRLCGEMFGLRVIRHRIFESNMKLEVPEHKKHHPRIAPNKSYYYQIAGHGGESPSYKLKDWQHAMDIDWMTKEELVEAIPPAYSWWLARQIREQIK